MSTPAHKPFLLASGSPRRSFLLKACGFQFSVKPTNVPEDFHQELPARFVPKYLAQIKAEASRKDNPNTNLIITADTVVILNNQILNKPADETEAVGMLERLSGRTHEVITAVGISTPSGMDFIECNSKVTFRKLNKESVQSYVREFKPLDKAGAYGAQECLPEGYNPCSEEEIIFLNRIGQPRLLEESKPEYQTTLPMVAIERIEGSYFNVMGLPIHLLLDPLNKLLNG